MRVLGLTTALVALITSASLLLPIDRAWGRSVKIRWKPIPGARQYELKILHGDRTIESETLSSPNWKGELNGGLYAYQIRGLDRLKKPGNWSELQPLFIAPKPPEAITPGDDGEFVTYTSRARTLLKWDSAPSIEVPGIRKSIRPSSYEIRIKDEKGEVIRQERVKGEQDAVELSGLTHGRYTFQVRPEYRLSSPQSGRAPASNSPVRSYAGEYSPPKEFAVRKEKLKTPEPISPSGKTPTPENRKLEFRWESVPGATAYQLQIEERSKAPRTLRVSANRIILPVPETGKLTWRVRAIASVEKEPGSQEWGPQSRAEVELEGVRNYDETSGYVAASGMLAPYRYELSGYPAVPSVMGTVRLSGEYYVNSTWGIGAGADFTGFMMSACSTCQTSTLMRNSYELLAKRRVKLPGALSSWMLAPKLGLELRNLVLVDNPDGASLQSTSFSVLGPSLGLDLRKALNPKLSLGAKLAYFLPIQMSGLSDRQLIPFGTINLSLGVQAFYWYSPRWGIGAGAYYDLRGVSFNSTATGNETLQMNSTNFFGSWIYSFGN